MATTQTCDFCGREINDGTGESRLFMVKVEEFANTRTGLERDACYSCAHILMDMLKKPIKRGEARATA